ncbi:glycoside hydrolase family 19 protein [Streptomyces sp. NPDC004134]|uniref:glycoside hydrolase family 19 protein n=1 Tax=Streptomyces sp. NPDC004134 TaxID=3364691 RepID=UPI0036CE0DDA
MSDNPRPGRSVFGNPRPVRTALATAAVTGAVVTALFAVAPRGTLSPAGGEGGGGPITGFAGKCVDVANGNPAGGTVVQLYGCNGTEAQRWSSPGDGTLRAFGKCLDVAGGGTAAGTSVQLWDCNGGPGQQWRFSPARDIVNPAADMCLDVRAYVSDDWTPLQIWTCTGADNQKWTAAEANNPPAPETPANDGDGVDSPSEFAVTEDQFNAMFPDRNPFYGYGGLREAAAATPAFAAAGGDTARKQEAAAFLANVSHETGGLVHVVEQNESAYAHYCDAGRPYGCPAGQDAYHGRGPVQLSWNYNYKAAGDALGLDLLNDPGLVASDPAVAWRVGLWYWTTQAGPGSMTPHDAMAGGHGFGETVRSLNGALECDGGNTAQVQSRVDSYRRFTQILGVDPGQNLFC